jgi:putative hydrolase of the HAD superfamily
VTDKRGVIWWDFDGTLVSRPVMWGEVALRVLDRDAPGHGVTSETMADLVYAGMPWHRPDHAHPDLDSADAWWEAVNERYRGIFAAVGHPDVATPASLAALRTDILNTSKYTVFDDVVPALERANAAGWRSMIVSNHIPELPELVSGLDLTRHFDTIVTSGIVGYEKPHRALFEAALRHVQPGEEVWMIGDNPDADCHPVCALGMKAVLVRGTIPGTFEREAPGLIEAVEIIQRQSL